MQGDKDAKLLSVLTQADASLAGGQANDTIIFCSDEARVLHVGNALTHNGRAPLLLHSSLTDQQRADLLGELFRQYDGAAKAKPAARHDTRRRFGTAFPPAGLERSQFLHWDFVRNFFPHNSGRVSLGIPLDQDLSITALMKQVEAKGQNAWRAMLVAFDLVDYPISSPLKAMQSRLLPKACYGAALLVVRGD